MATLMASGRRISLAQMVLGYIYHGLGEAASHPDHPGKANVIFPSHYVIGWLGGLFPYLSCHRPDSDCPSDFPTLVHYARLLGSKFTIPQARHIFRDGRYLSLRASSYREDSHNGRDVIDMGLSNEDFKFLLSIRALRQQRSIMDLGQAHADLQRRDTVAKFYVPPSYYEGVEEIFSVIKPAAKIKELVDVDRVKVLSDQDLTCSSKIAYIEGQLNNLSDEASKLQVKEQESLIEAESKLKSSLDLKKREAKQVKTDLTKAGFSKLQDLEKEKNHLKILIGSVISFNNV
ncbi:hypothetical protein Cgig2_021096 [Carnegiea gigantea]|uniref:Aminotransferase-like plant mobile domain-containing protein n=1 Tax=Carnegiea gigantea TaxID=171969 RepID=A0A9Q1QAV8_9CARY|nr:hypothetical protein Cgig2_021096 [Carnegiea gigantea]